MKVLLLINDVTYMSMISSPLLKTCSIKSIKDCFFLHLQELKNSLNRCREVCLPIRKSTRLLAVVDACEK
jgi:hypothetical protein